MTREQNRTTPGDNPIEERLASSDAQHAVKVRPPWDARVIGWAHVAFGILGLLLAIIALAGIAHPSESGWKPWRPLILFGTLEIHSISWQGVRGLLLGIAMMLGGYGLARGRRYGWWLILACNLESLPMLLVNLTTTPCVTPVWLVFYLLVLGWLLGRIRLYRPFGHGRTKVA